VVRIRVHLTQRISSQDARTGDAFGFDTSSSAEVAGQFLAAHTHGRGIVLFAQPAKGPVPGQLVLAAKTLDLPDGNELDVGLDTGQLDRSIDRDVRHYAGSDTNIVYDKGTEFLVVSPPQPTPVPDETP
jgi:hypothetical protein